MARTKKKGADYFPHDRDASDDEKIIYLESVVGIAGYALYFKMLEALCRADDFELEWNNIQKSIFARKFGVDQPMFDAFIVAATMPEIQAFCINNGKLFSKGLKKRMQPLVEKREKEAERQSEKRSEKRTKKSKTLDNPNSCSNNTDSCGNKYTEESRVEKSKENSYQNSKYFLLKPRGELFGFSDLPGLLQEKFPQNWELWQMKHGQENFERWLQEFCELHLEKQWDSEQDLKAHFNRFLITYPAVEEKKKEKNLREKKKNGAFDSFGDRVQEAAQTAENIGIIQLNRISEDEW